MADVSYPLDTTGISPGNLVRNELHTVTEVNARTYNLLVPVFAPFYIDNHKLEHVLQDGTTRELIPDVDYYPALPYIGASGSIGKMIYGAWSLNTELAVGTIRITYQTLGGDWCADRDYVLEALAAKVYNPRTTVWDIVTDKQEIFPPINHDQNLDYIYDSGELIGSLGRIADAILGQAGQGSGNGYVGHFDDKSNPHKVTAAQVGLDLVDNIATATDVEVEAEALLDKHITLRQLLTLPSLRKLLLHEQDKDNPHAVNKGQLGLENVENIGPVSDQEIADKVPAEKFLTFKQLMDLGFFNIGPVINEKIDDHVTNKANPHEVTAEQVGLGQVPNLPLASDVEVNAGDIVQKLITLRHILMHPVIRSMLDHAENKNNPHDVTKAQVGLRDVENISVATDTEVINRAEVDKHVVLRQLVQSGVFVSGPRAQEIIELHLQDKTNPHAVTADQVGLGNVANLPVATDQEVQDRQPVNAFITLKQLISSGSLDAGGSALQGLSLHLDDKANPHDVTAEQIGLGDVANLRLATDVEISNKDRVNVYFTWKQLIDSGIFSGLDDLGSQFQNHADDINNPHTVTAEQVGLDQVSNLPVASASDVINRISADKYITLAQLIATGVLQLADTTRDDLVSHRDNTNNPHAVSAEQVGLGNVPNLPLATDAEVQAYANVDAFITLKQLMDILKRYSANTGFAEMLYFSKQ